MCLALLIICTEKKSNVFKTYIAFKLLPQIHIDDIANEY